MQPTPQSIDYEVAPQSNLLQYVDHAGYKTDLGSEVEVLLIILLYHTSLPAVVLPALCGFALVYWSSTRTTDEYSDSTSTTTTVVCIEGL